MDATQLSETEILALAGLALHLASADGKLSAEEAEELRHLGEEIGGPDEFSAAIADAHARFKSAQDALDFAADIDNPKVREFIHTVITDLANADELHAAEAEMLARLRLMWGIRGQ